MNAPSLSPSHLAVVARPTASVPAGNRPGSLLRRRGVAALACRADLPGGPSG
ncbi:hypothetical protein ACFFX0_02060 [Citricoccus parietis]|uniref:Uncharacterized protein n=1 Tax=Citricoccus parietis TaxID=592307 RepID=A0ABV5FTP7_9MICC